jgi:membrane-bound lytic murein transglycosylase D
MPQSCDFAIKIDTLSISKNIPLSIISQVTGMDMRQLSVLNPAYKRLIVNGTKAAPRRLIIPQMTKESYALVYEAMNNDVQASLLKPIVYPVIRPVAAPVNVQTNAVAASAPARQQGPPEFYTVAYGETLDDIAAKYGLDPANLRKWNHLLSNKAPAGAKIRLTLPQAAANSNGNSPAVKNVSL